MDRLENGYNGSMNQNRKPANTLPDGSARPMHVMLVEDSNVDAVLVEAHLRKSEASFFVHRVIDVAGGLEYLKTSSVDVILLDLNLPDSLGIETFDRFHSRAPQIPIVVLSGQDDFALATAAVADGAQDYLPKEEASTSSLTRSIRYAIERSHRQRVEREVSAAGEIQRQLFPQRDPILENFDISGRCDPANSAGGDYFDFFEMSDQTLGIVIADVAGHGLGPALIMAQTRAILRSLGTTLSDVAEIMTRANTVLSCDLAGDVFVSLLLIRLDKEKEEMCFASAGQPGLLFGNNGKLRMEIKSQDPPLCVVGHHEYRSSDNISLAANESVFLYTDGIVEAMDSSMEQFGMERMMDVVQQNLRLPSRKLIDNLFDSVNEFCHHSQQDDMTAVAIRLM